MPLFKDTNGKLQIVKEGKFELEKDLQKLTENNLNLVFGLEFVSTEFSLHGFRIDTLAYDEEAKSFVVIEYKRDRSFSVIDQGYSYLSLMLNNKADFILEYNERTKESLKRDDIDWSQSRVIFVSNSFTTYQQNAINFKDLPIELWEAKKYDNSSILFNQLRSPDSNESIKTISKNKTIESVSREVRKVSVEEHFKKGWEKSKEIFEGLKLRILDLDPRVEEKSTKHYIGYQIGGYNLCVIKPRTASLRIELTRTQPKDLKDTEGRLRYMPNCMRFYNQHISDFDINEIEDVDYAMSLIKQVYKKDFS